MSEPTTVDTLIHDLLAAATSATNRVFAATPHGTYTFEITAVEGRDGIVILRLQEVGKWRVPVQDAQKTPPIVEGLETSGGWSDSPRRPDAAQED
jgi:hypothetical protein